VVLGGPASIGIGRVVSRTGFYKRWMVLGRSGIELARQESAVPQSPVGDAGITAADAAGLDWEAGAPADRQHAR